MRPRPTRGLVATGIALLALATSGCTAQPQPDPAAWILEPIPFSPAGMAQTDVAYAAADVAADGSGGFWTTSGGTWLHVDGSGETATQVNTDVEDPLTRTALLAPLSDTELIAVQRDPLTRVGIRLAVVDMASMTARQVLPVLAGSEIAMILDVAVRGRDVYALLLRFDNHDDAPAGGQAGLVLDVVRLGIDDRSRTVLHSEPVGGPENTLGDPMAPAGLDVTASGEVLLATPTGLVTLAADGTELTRARTGAADSALVIGSGDDALWWSGTRVASTTPAPFTVRGGSDEARASIERASTCDDGRTLSLISSLVSMSAASPPRTTPLPFLCGARAATWTGSSWVVAIGGEGDGVLVRVTPPAPPA